MATEYSYMGSGPDRRKKDPAITPASPIPAPVARPAPLTRPSSMAVEADNRRPAQGNFGIGSIPRPATGRPSVGAAQGIGQGVAAIGGGVADYQKKAFGVAGDIGTGVTKTLMAPTADFVQGATGLPAGDFVQNIGARPAPVSSTAATEAMIARGGRKGRLSRPSQPTPAVGAAPNAALERVLAGNTGTPAALQRPVPASMESGPPQAFSGPGARFASGVGANGEPVFDNSSLQRMQDAGGSSRFSTIDGGVDAARAAGTRAALAETGASYADLAAGQALTRPKFSMPTTPAKNGGWREGMQPTQRPAGERAIEEGIRTLSGRAGRTASAGVADLYRQKADLQAQAAFQPQAEEAQRLAMIQQQRDAANAQVLQRNNINAGLEQTAMANDGAIQQALIRRQGQPMPITLEDGSMAFANDQGQLTRVMDQGKPVRTQQQTDPRMALELQRLGMQKETATIKAATDLLKAQAPVGAAFNPTPAQIAAAVAQVEQMRTGRVQPPPEAIAELQASPETRAQFDEEFGPGAAARVLGN